MIKLKAFILLFILGYGCWETSGWIMDNLLKPQIGHTTPQITDTSQWFIERTAAYLSFMGIFIFILLFAGVSIQVDYLLNERRIIEEWCGLPCDA